MGDHLTISLHELVHAMDGYADQVLTRRFGVDFNLFLFLSPLATATQDITHLANCLNLTKAAVSKRVPALERGGWLCTSADPNHGRRVLLSLTPKGKTLVVEAGTLLEHRFTAVVAGRSIDAEALNNQLRGLLHGVRELPIEEELP